MKYLSLLLILASGCSANEAECPARGEACTASCPQVTARDVDRAGKCQRVTSTPICAATELRQAVTTCCASIATGAVYAVVGFPGCEIDGFRSCTDGERADETSSANTACK